MINIQSFDGWHPTLVKALDMPGTYLVRFRDGSCVVCSKCSDLGNGFILLNAMFLCDRNVITATNMDSGAFDIHLRGIEARVDDVMWVAECTTKPATHDNTARDGASDRFVASSVVYE